MRRSFPSIFSPTHISSACSSTPMSNRFGNPDRTTCAGLSVHALMYAIDTRRSQHHVFNGCRPQTSLPRRTFAIRKLFVSQNSVELGSIVLHSASSLSFPQPDSCTATILVDKLDARFFKSCNYFLRGICPTA